MVALVWWVALFESVTQKGIRAAAAPISTFAAHCDRDDLNVCKRAREKWRWRQLETQGFAEMPFLRERAIRTAQVSAGADAATCADRWGTAARRVVTIAASIPEDAADSPASS
jgi:hypothetical protein